MTSQMYSNRLTPFSLQEMAMEYSMAKIMVQRYEQMKMLQWYKCGAAYNLSAKKFFQENICHSVIRFL